LPAWTEIFRTFRVALDPRKLVIAAAGIMVMAIGWWLISWVSYQLWSQPDKEKLPVVKSLEDWKRELPGLTDEEYAKKRAEEMANRSRDFNQETERWQQLHLLAGSGYATIERLDANGKSSGPVRRVWGGKLRTMPWFEDRGPNPYMLITGQVERPWEKGHFIEWFITSEVPVLIEPLVKFLEPIIYVLHPKTSWFVRLYLILIILWTLATWAFFGGMITRMAAVEIAGKDPLTFKETFRFVKSRYLSYFCSPLVPLGLIAILVLVAMLFGVLQLIPYVGDTINGVLWPIVMLLGLGMALLLVGLVGFPLMYPTISAEGSDTLDAISRSYNYVFQSPWNFIWYSFVTILYGAVVTFFVGFLGSLTVYLGKWGLTHTTEVWTKRNPDYMMIYTPTSFGWRHMLLRGSPGEGVTVLQEEEERLLRRGVDPAAFDASLPEGMKSARAEAAAKAQKDFDDWKASYHVNKFAAGLVAVWVTVLFLLILGFGYSFFWCGSTMIYLLMRKKVDDTDMDEVYTEDSDMPDPFAAPAVSLTPPIASPPAGGPVMVAAPTLRNDKPSPPPEPPAPPTQPSAEPPPPTS
jgi:hypothetical protein